jgi:uncharacterized protein (DUF2249 family)
MILIDARGLEPPQPFELVMEALCTLQPGDTVRLVLEREPHPLFRVLERNGYRYDMRRGDDGSYQIDISAG